MGSVDNNAPIAPWIFGVIGGSIAFVILLIVIVVIVVILRRRRLQSYMATRYDGDDSIKLKRK